MTVPVLEPMIAPLRQIDGIRALRDATRGGVTAILHEFSQACGCGMNVYENKTANETVCTWCV
ncbi:hydrogenase formation protein [Proteus mirabilis]|uniref:Hydrogenase formation protein n=1 Tax=Proteus mirabilis TaxID=584 RepID=A0A379FJG6_PROMI|nr:hydrogenase formation protein [Proteus mirabilis]